MNKIKYNSNKIKFIQIVLIIKVFFTGTIGYCSTYPWSSHLHLIGAFAPIPIVVTLLTGAKTINHTGINTYTDTACNVATGNGINIGSPATFTFATSTTYFLGLSAYTNDLFSDNAQSIQVGVDADGGASGSVCIQISCSSSVNCAATSGPFLLSI
jgi:hypothetical protein